MFRKMTVTTLTLALGLPGVVLAEAGAKMDADGDGMVTTSEFEQAYPEADPNTFATIDANGDGALSAEEIEVAKADGTLPEMDSEG